MPNYRDPAAKVYASALMQVADDDRDAMAAVYDDLQVVRRLYDDDPYFYRFFCSPRLDRDKKWPAVHKALEGQVCRPVLGLLKVLIMKGRERLLDNVVDQFVRFKDLRENRVHAYVTVAHPMDAAFRASLQKRLEVASGHVVTIHEEVEPNVLGGAAIRIGDKVIDRTIRRQLAALRESLLEQTSAGAR